MFLRILCIVVVSIAFAGCASGPKFSEIQSKIPEIKSGDGRIFVYRDSVFGAAIQPKVYVNGMEVGTSQSNGFFFVDRPSGEYKISAATEVERSLSLALAPNETKYVRSYMSFGILAGRINFELVNAAGGQAAIQGLSFTGTTPTGNSQSVVNTQPIGITQPVAPIATANAQVLSGQWVGSVKCGEHLRSKAAPFTVPVRITVMGDKVTMQRGTAGLYSETSTGSLGADLNINLLGMGQMDANPADNWSSQFNGRFSKVNEDTFFNASGQLKLTSGLPIRDCNVQAVRTKAS
jgi:Protein of unknown function (DUF2846)